MTTWLEYQNINMIQRLNWQSKTWQSFALRAKEKKPVIWCFDQFWTSLQNKQNPLHIKLSTNLDDQLVNYIQSYFSIQVAPGKTAMWSMVSGCNIFLFFFRVKKLVSN